MTVLRAVSRKLDANETKVNGPAFRTNAPAPNRAQSAAFRRAERPGKFVAPGRNIGESLRAAQPCGPMTGRRRRAAQGDPRGDDRRYGRARDGGVRAGA